MKFKLKSLFTLATGLGLVFSTSSIAYAKGDLEKGKKVFSQYCASCHGLKGKGDGVVAASLAVKPANFVLGKFKYGSKDTDLKKIIKNGKGSMPPWGGALSDGDIDNVIVFIRSLKK